MESSHRNRSFSVPILTQIEKVLDRVEDCGVERNASEGSRFLETRSQRNSTRPKVKLSSGGLIRKQKRRHSRAVMESAKTDSPRQERDEVARPRAFTTGATDGNTVNNFKSTQTAIDRSEQPAVPVRSERCKSLPFLMPEEYPPQYFNDDSNNTEREEIGCGVLNREQTTETPTSSEGYREDKLTGRRLSLPASIQHDFEDRGKKSHSETTTDMTNSSTVDCTNLDKSNSLITDFDKLSMTKLKSCKQGMEDEFFQSGFEKRRPSLPYDLEQGNLFTEAFGEKSGFAADFGVDSVLQKTVKIKARQRSRSLPLTSFRFVGEPGVPLRDEYFNFSYCRHGEYCSGHPLDNIDKSNEHSGEINKSRRTRSKSLPLVLDGEGKADMSVSLRKHAKQSSLQSSDSSHDLNTKARRTQSPFIYEGFNEREILCDAGSKQIHLETHKDDSSENERAINTERKLPHDNGSIKQKAPLQRARSLPLRLQGAQHRQISDIQEDLNQAIDIFFSQINDKDNNVGLRGRSKSLPAVLEGKLSLDFTPVSKILEDNSNIPEIVIPEGNFYGAVGSEGCESQIYRESMPSFPDEEKIPNDESNSDASSDCEDLEAQISNSSFVADPPLVVRARGFSIPASFKMEKIPEEPNENENFEALSSCGEQGGNENDTNFVCEDQLSETMDCQAPVENVIVSEERRDDRVSQIVHDEVSSACDTVEEEQQPSNDYEHNIEIFNKMVSESSSHLQQLAFAKSSSCLHRASAKGDLEHLKLLVEEGHDVNALDESGWPVLHAAVTTGNFDCCAWLIDAGADLVEYTNFVIDEYRMLCRQVYLNY